MKSRTRKRTKTTDSSDNDDEADSVNEDMQNSAST